MNETNREKLPVNDEYQQAKYIISKPNLMHRIGCFILISIWLVITLIPFGIFILVIEGDITINHSGDIPDRHEHPRLQIQLINEIDFRGFGITDSSVKQVDDTNLCIETNVRYLLWQGKGEPATYCDCYQRSRTESTWVFNETTRFQCNS